MSLYFSKILENYEAFLNFKMAEGMVRIPGARPIKRRINKENDWNDRFWVNEPPKYDPMADVHCGTYLE